MNDGWHKLYEYDVYVEEEKVLRGLDREGKLVHPFKRYEKNKYIYKKVKLDTLRKALKRGSMILH